MDDSVEAILLVQTGLDEAYSVPLREGMITMGRGPLCEIVVEEPGVSRQHAGIRGDSEGFWIADLDSHNGTYVNGEHLGSEPRRLRANDLIELGGVTMPLRWVFMDSEATVEMPRLGASGA